METAPGSGYSTSIGGMQEGGLHDGDTVVITNTENPTDKAVTLRKVGESNADSSHTQSNLGGAVFTVYADKNGKPGEVVTVDNKRLIVLTSAADTGVISTGNLPNGTYWIHEDSAPKGYHTLTGDIKLVVGETLSVSPAFVTSDPESVCSVQDDGITIKIVNVRGASLPSTGGVGTGAFTVLGSVLALGAGWLLFRRRMQIM